ncbi:MAG: cupin domain-containing protein [Oscillospiraceae bacterium]
MIKKEYPIRTPEGVQGGNGVCIMRDLAVGDEMYHHARLFASVTLHPGCSIGWHVHEKETEFYYILKGTATVSDNGEEKTMLPGDVMKTGDGAGHSIENRTTEDLDFVALIVQA